MSISRVGIIQVVTAGTQSITVPTDATYALIFTKYYWGISPVAVTLGGQSCPVIISGPSSSVFTEVRGLSFPPTGSQTLVSGADYYSYPCVVIFYSGVNLFDPIVSAATSVTVDTDITGMSYSPGDMMVGGVSGYYTSPVVTDAAQTQIFLETSHGFGIAEKVSTGDFYYTMESGDYTPVAVVLRNMVSAVTLSPELLSSTSAPYNPTVTPGAASMSVPLLTSSSAVFGPALSLSLSVQRIDNEQQFFAPSVTPGVIVLSPPLIASVTQIYPPSASFGQAFLSLPVLESVSSIYSPAIVPGAVTVSAPFIDQTGQAYAPAVIRTDGLSVPMIPSESAMFSPLMTVGAVSLLMPALANSGQLYAPTLSAGALSVSMPFIDTTGDLFNPAVYPGPISVSLDLLINTSTVFAPSLAGGKSTLVSSVDVGIKHGSVSIGIGYGASIIGMKKGSITIGL